MNVLVITPRGVYQFHNPTYKELEKTICFLLTDSNNEFIRYFVQVPPEQPGTPSYWQPASLLWPKIDEETDNIPDWENPAQFELKDWATGATGT